MHSPRIEFHNVQRLFGEVTYLQTCAKISSSCYTEILYIFTLVIIMRVCSLQGCKEVKLEFPFQVKRVQIISDNPMKYIFLKAKLKNAIKTLFEV